MTDLLTLEIDGPIAVVTNNNPEKRNAFTDEMDQRLWEILAQLGHTPGLRAVIWRGEGQAFSSGRDVSALGGGQVELTHHELCERRSKTGARAGRKREHYGKLAGRIGVGLG